MFISKRKWEALQNDIVTLRSQIDILLKERNEEIVRLRKENEEYRNVKELLKPVKLKVKKTLYSATSDTVLIEYEAPTVILEFDNGKQTNTNDFLKSTNMLNIVGLEDQMKIQKEIKKATAERRDNDRK